VPDHCRLAGQCNSEPDHRDVHGHGDCTAEEEAQLVTPNDRKAPGFPGAFRMSGDYSLAGPAALHLAQRCCDLPAPGALNEVEFRPKSIRCGLEGDVLGR
jgi:hypothetical protein